MFKKINLVLYLLRENNKLKHKIKELSELSATHTIEKLLDRKISWYNYRELDNNKRKEYYFNAQAILDNEVFKNEMQHIISDTIKHIAKRSKNHEETQGNRMSINGLEVFRERLKSIENPVTDNKTKDNLHNVI